MIAFGLAVALAAVAGYGVASSVAPSTATLLPMPDIGDIQVGRNDAINTIEAQCAIIVGGFNPPPDPYKGGSVQRLDCTEDFDSLIVTFDPWAKQAMNQGSSIFIGAHDKLPPTPYMGGQAKWLPTPEKGKNLLIPSDQALKLLKGGGGIVIGEWVPFTGIWYLTDDPKKGAEWLGISKADAFKVMDGTSYATIMIKA